MTEEKSFTDLETQAQAMVRWLETQLHAYQSQCAMLVGQMAILEKRLASAQEPPVQEPSAQEVKTDG